MTHDLGPLTRKYGNAKIKDLNLGGSGIGLETTLDITYCRE
jgi:hypothetical protein